MTTTVTSRRSLLRFGILAAVCVAACASPGGGDTEAAGERLGTAKQAVTTTVIHSFAGGASVQDEHTSNLGVVFKTSLTCDANQRVSAGA